MSSINSILKFSSKYGGSLGYDNIGSNPAYRNLNSDRLRSIFDNPTDGDRFYSQLIAHSNSLMQGQGMRTTPGSVNSDEDFVRKVNKIKLNGGSLKDMQGAMEEYKNSNKCKCQNRKRLHNGNYMVSCNCNI